MIVIDDNAQVSQWISSLELENIGTVRLDLPTFEIAQGLESEIILIEDKSYLSLNSAQKEKLARVIAVVIFSNQDREIPELLPNVFNIINSNTPKNLLINQLGLIEDFSKTNNILKSQLLSLNMELSDTLGGVETQLLRVKKAYEKNAPKRLEQIKGLTVFSKYAAGENMGGEFFDIFTRDNKVFLMMSATSSYLISSSILKFFTDLKSQPVIDEVLEKNFINDIKAEVETLNKSKKKEVQTQLLTCILDLNTLKVEGHVFGQFNVLSSNVKHNINVCNPIKSSLDDAKFEIQLKRGERLLLNSPGFVHNWQTLKPKFIIEELIVDQKIKTLDVLDEIFFQLKKDNTSGFLNNDASSIILEVQSNVMVQV